MWNKNHQCYQFQYYVVFQLRNLMYYLNACYLIRMLSCTQNVSAVEFRPLLNQMNFYLSWLCVEMTSIMGSWHTCHNLVAVFIHIIFIMWVVFMEATFPWLNIKLDDGFLSYSMPEVIAWDEFKPVLHPEIFWT